MVSGSMWVLLQQWEGSEMNQNRQCMYESFFQELEEIEKDKMLKLAVAIQPFQTQRPMTMEEKAEAMQKMANVLALGNVARTGVGMLKHPISAVKGLAGMFGKKGVVGKAVANAPADAGRLGKFRTGAKALWNTPGGRATMIGAGGVAGATALGGAAALGRATAPRTNRE